MQIAAGASRITGEGIQGTAPTRSLQKRNTPSPEGPYRRTRCRNAIGASRGFLVEASCRYRKPARYDDEIVIETALARLGRASVEFNYRVVREADGELLATGRTEHCFLAADGRPARAPEALVALLERAPRATEV